MSTIKADERLLERAQRFYDEELRAKLEPAFNAQFVAVDPDHRRYAVGADPLKLFQELATLGCEDQIALLRVGYPAAFEMLRNE